jgi:hypothetical protein
MFLQLCKFPQDPEGPAPTRKPLAASTETTLAPSSTSNRLAAHRDLDEGVTSRHRRSLQYSARKLAAWLK